MKRVILSFFISLCGLFSYAQNKQVIKVVNATTNEPLQSVSIAVGGTVVKNTDRNGIAVLSLPAGKAALLFTSVGYMNVDTTVIFPASDTLFIPMTTSQKELGEVTIVSSTRNNQRIENSPMKVEVLGREEMEEER